MRARLHVYVLYGRLLRTSFTETRISTVPNRPLFFFSLSYRIKYNFSRVSVVWHVVHNRS